MLPTNASICGWAYDTCLAASGTLGRLSTWEPIRAIIPLWIGHILHVYPIAPWVHQYWPAICPKASVVDCGFVDCFEANVLPFLWPPKIHTHWDRRIRSLQTFHLQKKWKQTQQHGYNIWAGYELSLIMLLATQDQDLIHLGRFQQKLFAMLPPAAKPRRRLLVDRGSIRETWQIYLLILPKHGANILKSRC